MVVIRAAKGYMWVSLGNLCVGYVVGVLAKGFFSWKRSGRKQE